MPYSWQLIVRLAVPFLFSFAAVISDAGDRETFVIRYKEGEQTIPVTVVLDYKKQTEYVINMNSRSPGKSVTLYDFKQRTIAYKDLTNQECFLGRLTHETMRRESDALQDVKNPVESKPKMLLLYPGRPALTPTEIRNIAGQKTAVFCRKMNTWLVMPEKMHNINKREAGDYEERSYEHHGFHTVQYSHYGREVKRRYRIPNKVDDKYTAQEIESAGKENFWEPQNISTHIYQNNFPNFTLNLHSPKITLPQHNAKSENQMLNRIESEPNNGFRYHHKKHSNGLYIDRNLLENEINPPNSITKYSSIYETKEGSTASNTTNNNKLISNDVPDFYYFTAPKAYQAFHKEKEVTLKPPTGSDHARTERSTSSTDVPRSPHDPKRNHNSVSQNDFYLPPLYKPLAKEFDSDSNQDTRSNHFDSDKHNIETESFSNQWSYLHNRTDSNLKFADANEFHDPDVSVNVLEIPRITEKYQNISDFKSYPLPSLEEKPLPLIEHQSVISQYPVASYPAVEDLSFLLSGNIEDTSNNSDENLISTPSSAKRTEVPLYTEIQKTTLRPNYGDRIPRNEDIYISNYESNYQMGNLKNYSQSHKHFQQNLKTTEIPRESTEANSFFTTNLPLFIEIPKPTVISTRNINNNENLPPEDVNQRTEVNHRKNYQLPIFNITNKQVPPPKRYPSALQNFKPDQIIIELENIPTQQPPSSTSRFEERPNNIRPTLMPVPHNTVKSNADKRSGLILGTTQRSDFKPTINPLRRKNNYIGRTAQNGISFHVRKNTLYQNHPQFEPLPSQVSTFNRPHHLVTNYVQSSDQYPQVPHRSRSRTRQQPSSPWNQQNHLNQYNNLPPGVSVHPRHPQAPYAEMVRSNRPPTLPISDSHRTVPKPHRQRHHRRKSHKRVNSCCRLRNNSHSMQSCCRNGGHCCSGLQKNAGVPCCSSGNTNPRTTPPKQIRQPVRTDEFQKTEPSRSERCEREMCRTLYESTQQVMVCRNTNIEGC